MQPHPDFQMSLVQKAALDCWTDCENSIDERLSAEERSLLESARKASALILDHIASAYVPNQYGLQEKQ